MTATARDLMERLKFFASRLTRKLRRKRLSALILPPASPGSLGDDAMMTVCIETLRAKGFSRITVIDLDRNCPYKFSQLPDDHFDMSGYSWEWKPPQEYGFQKKLEEFDYFFVTGADVLDGHYNERTASRYLMLANLAERTGLTTTILGFSYNEHPAGSSLRALKNLGKDARLCARDPVSFRRLSHHLSRPLVQTADLAFLLKPARPTDKSITDFIENAKSNDSPIYGINAISTSKFFTNRNEDAERTFHDFYITLITRILDEQPDAKIVFIAHDYRPDGIGEKPVLASLRDRLPAQHQGRTLLPDAEYTAAEIKWIAGQLDFVVSSRMHLAIAALGQGTPAFCFEYQGKFEGLFELFGLPQLLSSMETALSQPESVIKKIIECLENRTEIRTEINKNILKVKKLSEKNFDA